MFQVQMAADWKRQGVIPKIQREVMSEDLSSHAAVHAGAKEPRHPDRQGTEPAAVDQVCHPPPGGALVDAQCDVTAIRRSSFVSCWSGACTAAELDAPLHRLSRWLALRTAKSVSCSTAPTQVLAHAEDAYSFLPE